jgi:hypothetical protein
MTAQARLCESAANIVENIAYRVAARRGGVVHPNHLMPYVPLSIALVRSCLDAMLDGHSVLKEEEDGFEVYRFVAPSEVDAADTTALEQTDECLGCGKDMPFVDDTVLCGGCNTVLKRELNRLADETGWPAEAVYEHEVLYLAARTPGPHHAAELAAHSRYTLKRMQEKLKTMTVAGALIQNLDEEKGTLMCRFPPMEYPKARFRRNIAVIRAYPASAAEDVELRVVRIAVTLGVMLVLMFVLALLRFPYPLLILLFLIAAPAAALWIWFRRETTPPAEEEAD